MVCKHCHESLPDVSIYCSKCGSPTQEGRSARRDAYAVQPTENVVQLALVSTVMPHTNRVTGNRYRWALAIAVVIVTVFTLTGILSAAILAAAFSVPFVYLLYIYDLNVWEDTPAPVVGLVLILTGVLGVLVSLVFYRWVFEDQFLELTGSTGCGPRHRARRGVPLVRPVAARDRRDRDEHRAGAARGLPKFDDMIDGLTFGVAAGTAFAAAETIVVYWSVFTSGELHTTQGVGNWIPVILSLMIVKALVYGSATGLAVAAFSGRGEGYDGFTGRYFLELIFAMLSLAVYWGGVRILAYADYGLWLGLIWGVIVLALLLLRIRVVLHTALLEVALEDAAENRRGTAAVTDGGWCPDCEMPLLPDAVFCVACGQSVRATSKQTAPRTPRARGSAVPHDRAHDPHDAAGRRAAVPEVEAVERGADRPRRGRGAGARRDRRAHCRGGQVRPHPDEAPTRRQPGRGSIRRRSRWRGGQVRPGHVGRLGFQLGQHKGQQGQGRGQREDRGRRGHAAGTERVDVEGGRERQLHRRLQGRVLRLHGGGAERGGRVGPGERDAHGLGGRRRPLQPGPRRRPGPAQLCEPVHEWREPRLQRPVHRQRWELVGVRGDDRVRSGRTVW